MNKIGGGSSRLLLTRRTRIFCGAKRSILIKTFKHQVNLIDRSTGHQVLSPSCWDTSTVSL